jgi:hypothetical protein
VVNKQVILESELEQAVHVEFLIEGKPLNTVTSGDVQNVLDQLIDRTLLSQQIVSTSMVEPGPDEVSGRLAEIRAQLPGANDNARWKALLAAYGVTQQDVESHIISQLRILRFVDLRFRGLAHADRAAVANYYQEKLAPELRSQGAPVPPLNQVSDRIEKILTEQRINDLLNTWIQTLRSQSQIRKMTPETRVAAGAVP